MTSPVSPAGTTSWQRGSQEACSTAPAKGEKIPTVFQKKAEGCDVAQQLSAQRGDQHPKTDNTQYPLTKRWSEVVQPPQVPELENQCLSPTEQIVEKLKRFYIDSETFRIFDNHFYESFPESLKAIYLDCKDDLQKCIKIDEDEAASEADLALLPKLLPPRITAITTEIIRLSKGIDSEIPVWLVPTVLILDELKTLLPGSVRKEYVRPLYQLTFAIRFNDEIPVDKRRALLIYMQAHGEELDFHANENLMFEHLITSLQDKDQPAPETALTAELEAVHIHESPSAPPLTPVKQEIHSPDLESGKTSHPSSDEQSKPGQKQIEVSQSASATNGHHKATAKSKEAEASPQEHSAPSRKKHKKNQQQTQNDEDEVAAAVKELNKSEIGKFANDLKRGNISKAIEHLHPDNINVPIADNGLPPFFAMLIGGIEVQAHHFKQLVAKGCNLNQSASVTINGIIINTSPLLFAMHQYEALLEMMTSASASKSKIEGLHKQMTLLEKSIESLLSIDRTGIDQPGQCIRGESFPEHDQRVITLTPFQFAVKGQLIFFINTLKSFGADPNTPLKAGGIQYAPVHVAAMTLSESTDGIFQTLLTNPKTWHIKKSDTPQAYLNVTSGDGSTPLHYLAKTSVMRLKNLEKTYVRGETRWLEQDFMNLCKVTKTLRMHGLDFEIKNKNQQTAEAHFRHLVEQEISNKPLKQDMLNRLAPLFTEQSAESARPEAPPRISSLQKPPASTQDSEPSGKKERKEQHKTHRSEMGVTVSTKPPADETVIYTRPVLEITGGHKAALSTHQEPPASTQDPEACKEESKKQQNTHQQKTGQDEKAAAVSELTDVVPTQPASNEPPCQDLVRYTISLKLGWVDQAMEKLTIENINTPIPDKQVNHLPPLFHIFNHKALLETKHVNSMIDNDCNLNVTSEFSINGKTVNTSVALYVIHRVAVLHSSTLSPKEKQEQEQAIYRNLSLLIKAGVDINKPAEFLREDIFAEFTTEPVLIYRPVQLATAKQQPEMVEYLMKNGANPNKPLQPGNLECYPVHVACMQVSTSTPKTLQALFTPGKFTTNPNQRTNDGSTPVHTLAEAAVMKVKGVETKRAGQSRAEVHNVQKELIPLLGSHSLKQMSETLRQHGTDFEQVNNNRLTALQFFKTLVEQEIPDPQVRDEMKKLDVFFTQQGPEPAQPATQPL